MLIGRSSISNSSAVQPGLLGDRALGTFVPGQTCAQVLRGALTLQRRLPAGVLWACLFIALVHATFTYIVFPYPVARRDLRQKVLAVTENKLPVLVFAGDSRADCNIDPSVIAPVMGLSETKIVNIGVAAGDSAMILAAYREFAERLAPHPILVVSVSPHFVSDRGALHDEYNSEYYWSVGIRARLYALSTKDVFHATFAPERHMVSAMGDYFAPPVLDPAYLPNGFRPLKEAPAELPGSGFAKTVSRLAKWRCFTVGEETSTPWRRLEADFEKLRALGAYVVVLDAPDHPEFLASLSGTPDGNNYSRYRATLANVCDRLSIPLLRYTVADLGSIDPDEIFWDGVHLNSVGANLLSKRVAGDLDRLMTLRPLNSQRNSTDSN